MADEAEVEDALCDFVVAALYPEGIDGLDETSPSVAGAPTKVQRGQPLSLDLEGMLEAGQVDVAVAARNGVERVTTRYQREWFTLVPPKRTITASTPGSSVTLGGVVSVPHNLSLAQGGRVLAVYAVQATDTLAGIATALAAAANGRGGAVTASGPALSAGLGGDIAVRVGGVGTAALETKRQDKSFQITVYAPSPELRDATTKFLDSALSDLNFLALPDGTEGLVRYERTVAIDTSEKMTEWRRDLFYWVEYPTIITRPIAEVVAFGFTATGDVPDPPPDPPASHN